MRMDEIVGVGKTIRQLRKQARITQKDVAARSGLTVSYLSRLENDRITPSVKTLRRIAEALEVPVSLLFGDAHNKAPEHCPVSLSGQCILEHRYQRKGGVPAVPPAEEESYDSEQLEILQRCNDILQHGDAELMTALERLMHSLVLLQQSRDTARARGQSTAPQPASADVIPATGSRTGGS